MAIINQIAKNLTALMILFDRLDKWSRKADNEIAAELKVDRKKLKIAEQIPALQEELSNIRREIPQIIGFYVCNQLRDNHKDLKEGTDKWFIELEKFPEHLINDKNKKATHKIKKFKNLRKKIKQLKNQCRSQTKTPLEELLEMTENIHKMCIEIKTKFDELTRLSENLITFESTKNNLQKIIEINNILLEKIRKIEEYLDREETPDIKTIIEEMKIAITLLKEDENIIKQLQKSAKELKELIQPDHNNYRNPDNNQAYKLRCTNQAKTELRNNEMLRAELISKLPEMIKNAPATKNGQHNTKSWRYLPGGPVIEVKLDSGTRTFFDVNGQEIDIIAVFPSGQHDGTYSQASAQITKRKYVININNDLNIIPYIPYGLTSRIAL